MGLKDKLSSPLARTRKALSELHGQSARVSQYQAARKEFEQTAASLRAQHGVLRRVQQEYRATAKPTAALTKRLKEATAAHKATHLASRAQYQSLDKLGLSLTKAGFNIKNLDVEQQRLQQQIDKTTRRMRLQQGVATVFKKSFLGIGKGFGSMVRGLGWMSLATNGLKQMGGAVSSAISPFINIAAGMEDFEAAMNGINGTGKESVSWLKAFAKQNPAIPITNLSEAFKSLSLAGMPAKEALKAVVDYNAGVGNSAEQANDIIGTLTTDWTRNRLGVGSSKRLQNSGVPVFELLERYTQRTQGKDNHKSADEFAALAKNGQLGREAIKALMEQMRFEQAGAAEDVQTSWGGMMDEIKARWQNFQLSLMDAGVFDYIKGKVHSVLQAVAQMASDGRLQAYAETLFQKFKSTSEMIENGFSRASEVTEGFRIALNALLLPFQAAYGLGEMVGDMINGLVNSIDRLFGSGLGDLIGKGAAKIMAKLGSKEAQAILDMDAENQAFAYAPPVPTASQRLANNPPANRAQVGGELKISIDSEGRPKVNELNKNGDMDLSVNLGRHLVGAM